MASDALCTECC